MTELLEGQAMEPEQERGAGQTEELLRKVLDLSAEETRESTRQKRRNTMVFFALAGVQALELAVLAAMGYELETMMKGAMGTYVMMVLLLGAHAWVVLKDRLPAYYDQYPIRDYTGGILHMSVGDLHFNNRNWPYVLRCLRAWSAFHAVLSGPFYWALDHLPAGQWQAAGNSVWILLVVGGLFIPVYIAGKRYE